MPNDALHFSKHDLITLFGVFVGAYILNNVVKTIYVAYFTPLSKIPGPALSALSGLPSSLRTFKGTRHVWVQNELYPKYGKLIRIAPTSIVVMDKDAIKRIIVTEDLPKHPKYEALRMSPKQETLFSATNRLFHKQRRRMLSPAFSMRYISSIEPLMQSCLQDFLEELRSILQEVPSSDGMVVNIHELINHLTLDIIGNTAFGGSFNLIKTGRHLLPKKVDEELAYRAHTATFAISKLFRRRDDYLIKFTTNIINERRKHIREMRKDILQIMLDAWDEDGAAMTDLEIYDQLIEFIIAGSDTTSFSMYNLIRFLVTNPDKKKCLVEELDAELSDCSPKEIHSEKLKSMPYLNACISESMRLRPIALEGGTVRIADNDIMLCGHVIPKGTLILPNVFQLQRSTEYWGEDALEFRPERWLDKESIPRDCYYPFSGGSRNCIGVNFALQEMRSITASLFKAFNIEFVPGQPPEDIRHHLTPRLNNGTYCVRLSARK